MLDLGRRPGVAGTEPRVHERDTVSLTVEIRKLGIDSFSARYICVLRERCSRLLVGAVLPAITGSSPPRLLWSSAWELCSRFSSGDMGALLPGSWPSVWELCS